jgi:Signal transduction histidine kinase
MGLIAVMVVGGAFLTTRLAEQRLMDQVDDRLSGVPALFDRGFGPPRADTTDPALGRPTDNRSPRGFNEFFVAQIDATGTLIVRGRPNVSRRTLPAPTIDVTRARAAASADHPRPYTVSARSTDLRYRVLPRVEPLTGDTFVLAAPLASVDASTSQLRNIAWTVAALVLAVLAVVTWWVLRLGIRPLKRMASAAVTIADDDLGRRVPEASKGTEAGDLSHAINNMLGRLEESFAARAETDARLRRFVGDASHELRTPVQTIRGYSELYAAGALASTDQLDDAMRRTGQESVRMAKLIDELLTLARLDQHRPIEHEPVDLLVLANDALADAHAIEPQRATALDTHGPADALVNGDEHLLRQVLGNLVGNALVHTPPSSPITITVRSSDDQVEVTVTDTGPGMDHETAAHAFERFVRADPARTRQHGGSGLGLAIVHDGIAAHGGTVELRSDLERGTVVEFRIPRDIPPTRATAQPEEHGD